MILLGELLRLLLLMMMSVQLLYPRFRKLSQFLGEMMRVGGTTTHCESVVRRFTEKSQKCKYIYCRIKSEARRTSLSIQLLFVLIN